MNVDILTGKEAVSVYFDPAKAVDCDITEHDWIGENLYLPAIIIKEEQGLVKYTCQINICPT
jgi:hypothetical protein